MEQVRERGEVHTGVLMGRP